MKDHSKSEATPKHYLILIAEDDDINYHFLAMLLANLNPEFELLHARDGLEAVSLYKANANITLVLMDIKMPNMDGYEATKLIKAINPKAKIIAQTALNSREVKDKALEAGCDDFITKPVDKNLLKNSIENLTKSSF
jgi:CheY-like chemotaxis protein